MPCMACLASSPKPPSCGFDGTSYGRNDTYFPTKQLGEDRLSRVKMMSLGVPLKHILRAGRLRGVHPGLTTSNRFKSSLSQKPGDDQ